MFSGRGDCVDVWAPGTLVTAADAGEPIAFSGTSAAAALTVATIAARTDTQRPGDAKRDILIESSRVDGTTVRADFSDPNGEAPLQLIQPFPRGDRRCAISPAIGTLHLREAPTRGARSIV